MKKRNNRVWGCINSDGCLFTDTIDRSRKEAHRKTMEMLQDGPTWRYLRSKGWRIQLFTINPVRKI